MSDVADGADREVPLRAYLLGLLPVEQREEIEERALADEALHAELQATADDLIHAYLAGELSEEERERFETHFLASPRRRERVAFVRSLVAAVGRVQSPAAPAARPARLLPLLPWAAVLVIGLAGGWSIGERRRSERDLAQARQREDSLRQQLLARDERVRELESRAAAGSEPADLATWTLRSGVERGAAAADAFTVRGDWIRLRVPLEHDLRVASYRISLQTAAGREVLRVGGLREVSRAGGRTVDVIVPSGLLRPGSYLLSVQRDGAGAPDELTATTFQVR